MDYNSSELIEYERDHDDRKSKKNLKKKPKLSSYYYEKTYTVPYFKHKYMGRWLRSGFMQRNYRIQYNPPTERGRRNSPTVEHDTLENVEAQLKSLSASSGNIKTKCSNNEQVHLEKKLLGYGMKGKKKWIEFHEYIHCSWKNCTFQTVSLKDMAEHLYKFHIYNRYVFKDELEDDLKKILGEDDVVRPKVRIDDRSKSKDIPNQVKHLGYNELKSREDKVFNHAIGPNDMEKEHEIIGEEPKCDLPWMPVIDSVYSEAFSLNQKDCEEEVLANLFHSTYGPIEECPRCCTVLVVEQFTVNVVTAVKKMVCHCGLSIELYSSQMRKMNFIKANQETMSIQH